MFRVLFVDDDPAILQSMARILHKEAYEVLVAESGRAALDIMASCTIHVIVSDERMPAMTGSELLARVKAFYPQTVRIMLTGQTSFGLESPLVDAGAYYRFLMKPLSADDLKQVIAQALRMHALTPPETRRDSMPPKK
jgi:DNA-binding NtrC family response regulator